MECAFAKNSLKCASLLFLGPNWESVCVEAGWEEVGDLGQGRFGDDLVYGERSLEVQDGLFSYLYFKALWNKTYIHLFILLNSRHLYSLLFSLNSVIIILEKWYRSLFLPEKSMVLLSILLRIIKLHCKLIALSESFKKWFIFREGFTFFLSWWVMLQIWRNNFKKMEKVVWCAWLINFNLVISLFSNIKGLNH